MLKNELDFSNRKISRIQRFLIICSGADKSIIEKCPTEWNKYAGIGATIFFTGLLACLSGGYALYTVFKDTSINTIDLIAFLAAIFFGLIWGLIIFNLDRFIVSTFYKINETDPTKRFIRELLQTLPRIFLAVIIALVISKPIEIKIFESRLAEQILQNEINARKKNRNSFEDIHGMKNKIDDISVKERKDSILKQELTEDPHVVKDLINIELKNSKLKLIAIEQLNAPKINAQRKAIFQIEENQNNYRPIFDQEGKVEYDTNGDIKQSLTKDAQTWIAGHKVNIKKLQDEITLARREIDKINEQILKERKKYREDKQADIKLNAEELGEAKVGLDSAKVKIAVQTGIADSTSKRAFTNNFITQIEALGHLTREDSTMWWTSLMITLLFLTIELAPILTKLITKRGMYDEILDRVEYQNKMMQKEAISRQNSEINALVKQAEESAQLKIGAMLQMDKDRLDAEMQNNKIILDKIAKNQQELALEIIEKWYKENKDATK